MADVGWWRWRTGERLTAPFFRFVKGEPSRLWFSDGLYQAVGEYRLETGRGGDMVCHKKRRTR